MNQNTILIKLRSKIEFILLKMQLDQDKNSEGHLKVPNQSEVNSEISDPYDLYTPKITDAPQIIEKELDLDLLNEEYDIDLYIDFPDAASAEVPFELLFNPDADWLIESTVDPATKAQSKDFSTKPFKTILENLKN